MVILRADDWIIDYLIKQGVTDIFGIPGVVVLDFLYAAERRNPEIVPHLAYHEQGAAFAACGYAQISGKLGVAYSTRGPGLTNMITAIADAYYDSIPTVFITAHATLDVYSEMRVMNNQEIDTVDLVKNISKKAVRIDRIEELQTEVIDSIGIAMKDRKGPVVLDIWSGLFSQEVSDCQEKIISETIIDCDEWTGDIQIISEKIRNSKRPILLIGNGVRDKITKELIREISEKNDIPILSSRIGQDILPDSFLYYGYVGSRASRYSNFILSKADLIVVLGNRMAFPINSKSYKPLIDGTEIIRIEIDKSEFSRSFCNSTNLNADVSTILSKLVDESLEYENSDNWISVCNTLRDRLNCWDTNPIVETIDHIIHLGNCDVPILCDVGNNSFWVSLAYTYSGATNRILYSGSFGTLGCAIPKSIGAYFETRKPVLCFVGDQGFQFNIQELQFISSNKLPISIVVLNNQSSGMIMERQKVKYEGHLLHTTLNDGYGFPSFEDVARCYGIKYIRVEDKKDLSDVEKLDMPQIIEVIIDQDVELSPSLPLGNECQDLFPAIPREVYMKLNNL